ncbi:hypothetical protein ACHAXT_005276 [Thalassiosira profunda]
MLASPVCLWGVWACMFVGAASVQAFVAPQPKDLRGNCHQASTASSYGDGAGTIKPLSHSDIEWKLRPPEDTSRLNRLKYKLGANILRWDSKLKGDDLPPVLCPKGGRALLEAYYKEPGRRKKKIARFGFTTSRGPSSTEIDTTIREKYNIDPPALSATIAAIIYMFVEEDYRSRDVGALALEVISAVQSVQGVDFTVLVADDNGSGGLVRWYEEHGYAKAPLLQNILGSPDGVNGVAMIAPVKIEGGFFGRCTVKWW